jgi:hypothetical protein
MAKTAKSPLKPFVILISTSVVVWAIFIAIHGMKSKRRQGISRSAKVASTPEW